MRKLLLALIFVSGPVFAQPVFPGLSSLAEAMRALFEEINDSEELAAEAARQHCERTKKADPKARC